MISYCTWIYNRLWQYQQTIEKNLARAPEAEFILVDLSSTDGVESWLEETKLMDRVRYFQLPLRELHHSKLKNLSHSFATGDRLVNLDADNVIGKSYHDFISRAKEIDVVHTWSKDWNDGTHGRISYSSQIFKELGGYDESLSPNGYDDIDLLDRAKALKFNMVTSHDPTIVGYAIKNSSKETNEFFTSTRYDSNFKNYQISQHNLKAGKFKANQ